eukprot:1160828-Pelagomonas_calceolata.AAC.15
MCRPDKPEDCVSDGSSVFVCRLVKRPTSLPEFVSWMELVWNHLDDTSSKRQQITVVHEQLGVLHRKLMAVSEVQVAPKPMFMLLACCTGGSWR